MPKGPLGTRIPSIMEYTKNKVPKGGLLDPKLVKKVRPSKIHPPV